MPNTSLPSIPAGNFTPMSLVMPESLRTLKLRNTVSSALISIALVVLLLYCIATKTGKTLRPYRKILVLGAMADLQLALAFLLFSETMVNIDGSYIMLTDGIMGDRIPFPISMVCHWMNFYAGYSTCCIAPIQYVYRAILINFNFELTTTHITFLVMIALSLAGGVSYAFLWHFVPTAEMHAQYDKYFDGPQWHAADGSLPTYLARPVSDLKATMILYPVMFGLCYGVIAVCSVSIMATMWRQMAQMSSITRGVQRQITVVLFVQAFVPFLTVVAPVVIDVLTIAGAIYIPQAGYVAVFAVVWSPVMNPIVTILFVRNYRVGVIRMMKSGMRRVAPENTWFALGDSTDSTGPQGTTHANPTTTAQIS